MLVEDLNEARTCLTLSNDFCFSGVHMNGIFFRISSVFGYLNPKNSISFTPNNIATFLWIGSKTVLNRCFKKYI